MTSLYKRNNSQLSNNDSLYTAIKNKVIDDEVRPRLREFTKFIIQESNDRSFKDSSELNNYLKEYLVKNSTSDKFKNILDNDLYFWLKNNTGNFKKQEFITFLKNNIILYRLRNLDIINPVNNLLSNNMSSEAKLVNLDSISIGQLQKQSIYLKLDSQVLNVARNMQALLSFVGKGFPNNKYTFPNSKDLGSYLNAYKGKYSSLRAEIQVAETNYINSFVQGYQLENNVRELDRTVAKVESQVMMAQAAIHEEQTRASGFRIPSESDMIKALAQFMANRAKQEALIWFLRRLQKDMQSPLLWDMFPETKRLADAYDGMAVPDLNDTWRMALSKDLVQMPNNLVDGQWLETKARLTKQESNFNMLKDVVSLSNYFYKMVREKNNYRSVLQNLYLASPEFESKKDDAKINNSPKDSTSTHHLSNVQHIINVLYVISNEFYFIHEDGISYLTLDQLDRISDDQWNKLLSLVRVKYGDKPFKSFEAILHTSEGEKFNKARLIKVVQNFAQLQTLSHTAATADQQVTFSLVWDKMIELLKFADPNYDSLKGNFNARKYRDIAHVDALHKIYGHISRKEFKPAVNNTIDLIKPLIGVDNFVVTLQPDSLKFDKVQYINKDQTIRQELIALNLGKSKKFSKLMQSVNAKEYSIKEGELFVSNINEGNKCDKLNLNTLTEEFKKIRFNLFHQDLTSLDAIQFAEVNKLMKAVFANDKLNATKLDEKLKLLNLLVDIYDNPKSIFTKPIYADFGFKQHLNPKWFENTQLETFVKVGGMFANIVNSRDQSGIYNAIQEMAAPPETYMIKRNSTHTWTLNGYVGGFAGYQNVLSNPSDYMSSFIYGVTAPIGITYNYKNFGIFFQGLELGNVVNHYLWNRHDHVDRQKLSVKEMFSPGISFLRNIPNGPFVAFVGVKGVQIEKRYEDQVILNNKNLDLLQFTAGVKIDIPFFTIVKR